MKVTAQGAYVRPLKVSDATENFLKNVEKDGQDANALASVLLEMAVQMLRHGHIQYHHDTLRCQTDQGKVEVNLSHRRPPATPYDR